MRFLTLCHPRVRRRRITTESIGSAATHPSLRGALATKQSRGHNMRGATNQDGRTAAPGLLRFANKTESTAFGEARFVIPAKAGIQRDAMRRRKACAWR